MAHDNHWHTLYIVPNDGVTKTRSCGKQRCFDSASTSPVTIKLDKTVD